MLKKILMITIFILLFTISWVSASDVDITDDNLNAFDHNIDLKSSDDVKLSNDNSILLEDSQAVVNNEDSILSQNLSSTVSSQNNISINQSASQMLEVEKKSKTKIKVAKKENGYMTSSNYIMATLLDSKSKAIKNKPLIITIGKKSYSAKTDSKGVAKIKTPYKKGDFVVKFRFKGDKTYYSSSANAKLKINRMITRLKAPSVSAYVTRNALLKINLTDAYGKALAKKSLNVKISGKNYKVTTNQKGIANLKIKKAVGTYNCRINFPATNKFHRSYLDTKVIFKKLPTVIKAPSVKFKSTDYAVLKINLNDKFGAAVKNKTITINVTDLNNVFKVKTDSKGVAKFKFNGEKSYNLVLSYAGGKSFNPCSVKSKLNIDPIKIKFEDIVTASIKLVDYVNANNELPDSVESDNHNFTITQFSYLAARALKNICNNSTEDVVLISVPKEYNSSGEIFDTVYKKDFLQIAESILDSSYNYKNKDFVKYSFYELPFKVHTLAIARILRFYNNNGVLPNYCLMTTADFIPPYSSGELNFYLTSDYLYPNNEENRVNCFEMLKSLKSTLNSMGYNAKIVGMGPDSNNVAYSFGCKGNESVLLCCFSGVDVGCIEIWAGEIPDGFVENYAGAHVLGLWYTEPFGRSADIHGYVPRAYDADYGWALDNPAEYMEEHNISYIEVGTVEEACQALLNGDMGGPQLLPKNNLIGNKEDA